MVPGLHVARIDSNKWAITSRGFNDRFADDLLVLMDGRTVYSPLVAGTFWEVQDTPHGGKIGQDFNFRVYEKAFERDKSFGSEGAQDDWRMGRTGFRVGWDLAANDSVTVQGDYYQANSSHFFT